MEDATPSTPPTPEHSSPEAPEPDVPPSPPREVLEALAPEMYAELRRRAHWQRLANPASDTLNTTALVHETYLRLASRAEAPWENERQFYYYASRIMRDILIDYARKRRAQTRGGPLPDLPLDALGPLSKGQVEEILEVNDALERLAELDARQAKAVELRYFIGLTIPEVAEILDVSTATVKRDWAVARAWLYREMR